MNTILNHKKGVRNVENTLEPNKEVKENKEEESYSYASISDRLISYLRDYLLIFLISILIGLTFIIIDIFLRTSLDYNFRIFGFNFAYIFFSFFGYPIVCITGLLSDMHATRSQYKMGMCVVNENGEFLTTNIVSIEKGQKGNPRKNKRNNRKSVKKLEKYLKTQMLEYMEL